MTIQTKAYGTVEIDERQVIDVSGGLFGFEHLRKYALIDAHKEPFYWLQSLDQTEVAFVLLNPLLFRPDYTLDTGEDDLAALDYETPEDLLVFCIVTIPEDDRFMTANLQGPVVINRKSQVGRQVISTNRKWGVRHNIREELSRMRSDAC